MLIKARTLVTTLPPYNAINQTWEKPLNTDAWLAHDLLESLPVPTIILSPEMLILDINSEALKIYPWQKHTITNNNLVELCGKTNMGLPLSTTTLHQALLNPGKTYSEAPTNIYLFNTTKWSVICADKVPCGNKVLILSGQNLDTTAINSSRKNYIRAVSNSMVSLLTNLVATIKTNPEATKSIHASNKNINATLREFITFLPGQVYWQDTNLTYLGCNECSAEIIGLSSADDLIGKNDDFIRDTMGNNYPTEAYALWRKTSKTVIQKKITIVNSKDLSYSHPETKNQIQARTSKTPILDADGTVIGVLGLTLNANNPQDLERLYASEKKLHELLKASKTLNDAKLSKREIQCIELLAKGKTMKEAAAKLYLSPRTVETYLTKAKTKLGCFASKQLVDLFWDTDLSSDSAV
jgi:DNA-binding CsgD family transcriptional regulator